ncbi:hypothetical protein PACTADRAFT_17917 [Pachysolen tannophilus NRRL Y-2460]|uniref:Uncharacterized protein n=1 Tax=Pachysolen tannophilus NRRL Y-2460 TaxID=669874 RepID=A0A1E4TQZ1_PACTA|nr:hypothetical protein PACTADRAFT_17917 [Pachysolen tannophilus NRRL Y-2460]
MRSLPPPRYSRYRTARRIGRAIRLSFTTGYISDSSAFNKRKRQSKTKIRTTRLTRRTTTRPKVRTKLNQKLISTATNGVLPMDELYLSGNDTDEFIENVSKFRRLCNWFRRAGRKRRGKLDVEFRL